MSEERFTLHIGGIAVCFFKELRDNDIENAIKLFRNRSVYAAVIGDYVVTCERQRYEIYRFDYVITYNFYRIHKSVQSDPEVKPTYSYSLEFTVEPTARESQKIPEILRSELERCRLSKSTYGFIDRNKKLSETCGRVLKQLKKRVLDNTENNLESNVEKKASGFFLNVDNTNDISSVGIWFDILYKGETNLLHDFLHLKYRAIVIGDFIMLWNKKVVVPSISVFKFCIESIGNVYKYDLLYYIKRPTVNIDIDDIYENEMDYTNPHKGEIDNHGNIVDGSSPLIEDFSITFFKAIK